MITKYVYSTLKEDSKSIAKKRFHLPLIRSGGEAYVPKKTNDFSDCEFYYLMWIKTSE